MDKVNVKLKFRYYLIPQGCVSLLIATYPYFCSMLITYLHRIGKDDFYYHNKVTFNSSLILATIILAYFSYGRNGVMLFDFFDRKWGRRVALFILPIIIGLGGALAMQLHVDQAKIRSYSISNISELKNIYDSTEVYNIEYYNILYDEYFYTEYAEYVNIGTSKYPRYATEVYTDVVCPVLINFSSEYDLKKQSVWIGFHISKQLPGQQSFESLLVEETWYENLTTLHSQKEVIYFTETRDKKYIDLIKEKSANNSIPYKRPIILEAHYIPYEPYNGYKYLLNGFYFYLGANVFIIFCALITDIHVDKKEKLLKRT